MKNLRDFTIFIISILLAAMLVSAYFLIEDNEAELPKQVREMDNINVKEYKNRDVYIIEPANKDENSQYILYFHGGAYMGELENYHWNFIQKISKETGYGIIIPDYPLTPKNTYKDVFDMVEPLYTDIIKKINPEKIIMMGDSAGGGLALALEEDLGEKEIQVPNKLILISPWIDTTMKNKKIDEVQKNDTDLNKEKLKLAGIAYAGSKTEDNYLINPIKGPIQKLKNVIIYTGTYDILNPDAKDFVERAKKEGINIYLKEYETAGHIWILKNNDELANKAFESLIRSIKNEES